MFPLFLIFRKSLDEGIFLDIWKLRNITPIYKSDDKSDVFNYRLISIISHIGSSLESIILCKIQPSVNKLLCDKRHGFCPHVSTLTCILVFVNYDLEAFKCHSQVDVIYFVFYKTINHVCHKSLI